MGPRGALHSFGEQADGRVFEWRIVARLLGYLRPYWRRMLAALAFMLVASALTLATPYLVKLAIDQSIANGDISGLTTIALLTAATFVGIYVTSAFQRYLLSWVGQRVLATLRSQLPETLMAGMGRKLPLTISRKCCPTAAGLCLLLSDGAAATRPR